MQMGRVLTKMMECHNIKNAQKCSRIYVEGKIGHRDLLPTTPALDAALSLECPEIPVLMTMSWIMPRVHGGWSLTVSLQLCENPERAKPLLYIAGVRTDNWCSPSHTTHHEPRSTERVLLFEGGVLRVGGRCATLKSPAVGSNMHRAVVVRVWCRLTKGV